MVKLKTEKYKGITINCVKDENGQVVCFVGNNPRQSQFVGIGMWKGSALDDIKNQIDLSYNEIYNNVRWKLSVEDTWANGELGKLGNSKDYIIGTDRDIHWELIDKKIIAPETSFYIKQSIHPYNTGSIKQKTPYEMKKEAKRVVKVYINFLKKQGLKVKDVSRYGNIKTSSSYAGNEDGGYYSNIYIEVFIRLKIIN